MKNYCYYCDQEKNEEGVCDNEEHEYNEEFSTKLFQEQTSKFREYYNDPEFKKRHKAYLCEKVECECGFVTGRSNMTRHKKSTNHSKRMALLCHMKECYEKYGMITEEEFRQEQIMNSLAARGYFMERGLGLNYVSPKASLLQS